MATCHKDRGRGPRRAPIWADSQNPQTAEPQKADAERLHREHPSPFTLQRKNRGPERGSHAQVTHRAELNTMGSRASCLLLEHQLHATYSVEETVYLPWNLGAELCRCKKPQQGSMLLARAHSCAFPGGGGYLLTPRGDSGFVPQYTELPRLPAASD